MIKHKTIWQIFCLINETCSSKQCMENFICVFLILLETLLGNDLYHRLFVSLNYFLPCINIWIPDYDTSFDKCFLIFYLKMFSSITNTHKRNKWIEYLNSTFIFLYYVKGKINIFLLFLLATSEFFFEICFSPSILTFQNI